MPIPENKRNTNGFDKNPQNINRSGRNRKTVSRVILELQKKGAEPVSPKQIVDLFQALLNCNIAELTEIATDKEQPMLNRIIAKEMTNSKGFDIIEKMLDRVHGRAVQRAEVETTNVNSEPLTIKIVDE